MSKLLKLAIVAAVFGAAFNVIKLICNGPECKSSARVDGKVIIVTGANSGLGKETVLQLALRGGRVYMACRNMVSCRSVAQEIIKETEVDPYNVIPIHLDLGSMASIRKFVSEFKTMETQLDILINNAGIVSSSVRTLTEDGFESTFAINHLGHFLLTNLLIDHLLVGQPSRIINVSAKAHLYNTLDWNDLMTEKDFNNLKAYGRSKTANILFTKYLHKKLSGHQVTSYSLHPGVFVTGIIRNVDILGVPIDIFFSPLLWIFGKDMHHAVQTSLCCAIHEDVVADSGKYFSDCEVAQVSEEASLELNVDRLWKISVELLQLKDTDIHPALL